MNAPLKLKPAEWKFKLLDEVSRTRALTDEESRELERTMQRIRIEVLRGIHNQDIPNGR